MESKTNFHLKISFVMRVLKRSKARFNSICHRNRMWVNLCLSLTFQHLAMNLDVFPELFPVPALPKSCNSVKSKFQLRFSNIFTSSKFILTRMNHTFPGEMVEVFPLIVYTQNVFLIFECYSFDTLSLRVKNFVLTNVSWVLLTLYCGSKIWSLTKTSFSHPQIDRSEGHMIQVTYRSEEL